MAMRRPASRNLWIIAAVVLIAAALLAWILDSGAGPGGGDFAEVSVAPPPRSAAAGDRSDLNLAEAVSDALAPPSAGTTAGGN